MVMACPCTTLLAAVARTQCLAVHAVCDSGGRHAPGGQSLYDATMRQSVNVRNGRLEYQQELAVGTHAVSAPKCAP